MSEYRDLLRRHYTPLLKKFGPDYRAVDWGSGRSQRTRFRVLLEIGEIKTASILDVGCGVGHLVDYLKDNGFVGVYCGIDLVDEMIAAARSRHANYTFDNAGVEEAAARIQAEYVIASGLFTFADRDRLHDIVRTMFNSASKGIAFNSLSAWATKQEAGEFYADPVETMEFCRTLTPWIVLRHDYHPGDFTVYMYTNAA